MTVACIILSQDICLRKALQSLGGTLPGLRLTFHQCVSTHDQLISPDHHCPLDMLLVPVAVQRACMSDNTPVMGIACGIAVSNMFAVIRGEVMHHLDQV